MSGAPQRFYDTRRGQFYYLDPRSGAPIYANEQQQAGNAPNDPRTPYQSLPQERSRTSNYLGSSPPRDAGYSYQDEHTRQQYAGSSAFGSTASYGVGPAGGTALNPGTPAFLATPGVAAGLSDGFANLSISAAGTYVPPQNAITGGYRPGPIRPILSNRGGERIVTAYDPVTQVTTEIATSPSQRITDPALHQRGIRARGALRGTPGDEEALYSSFRVRRTDFFKTGRVFFVCWSEPAGDNFTAVDSIVPNDRAPGVTAGIHGVSVYSKVRRFVIIREGHKFCSALPIVSYGKQGVGKPGVVKSDHGIIYTTPAAPLPLDSERPDRGEAGMRSRPIRVVPDDPEKKLDPMSRIDYAKIYTIHHNLKVAPFGNVHDNFREALATQARNVWFQDAETAASSSSSGTAGATAAPLNQGSQGVVQDRVQNLRRTLHNLKLKGYTDAQAHESIVQAYMKKGRSRGAAIAEIKGLLAATSAPVGTSMLRGTAGKSSPTAGSSQPDESDSGKESSDGHNFDEH